MNDDSKLQAIITESPLPTVLFDRDGRIELWNRAAEELFGWTADEVIGQTRNPWVPDEALPQAEEFRRRSLAGEVIRGVELRRRRKDGSAVDLLFYQTAYTNGAGEIIGFVVRAVDITERKRLEADLRRTSELLHGILDASPLAIIAVDSDGLVTFWSQASERLYGWRRREVLGQLPPHIGPDVRLVLDDQFRRVRAGETLIRDEVERRTRSGQSVEVAVHIVPLTDGEGEIVGLLTVQEDIRERRRLEAELFEARKMETVGRLAGGVAHDFNNIMTAIIGFASLALEESSDTAVERNLEAIQSAAERAAGLTRQLLAFGRRQVLNPRLLDANEEVLRLEPMLRRLIGEQIDLVVSVEADAGAFAADPTQLQQVLLNLAVNARDAMPAGGRLVIRTGHSRIDAEHEHFDMAAGDYTTISVIDTGVGMDEATRARVFEPFFTTKEVGKGTGLGLATTYGIVRQSGGSIWVYSEPGRGSTFRLYFPRHAPVSGVPEPVAPRRSQRSARILLVEDEPLLRKVARQVLERAGFDVEAAANATEAIALLDDARRPFDLLLTDVVMPGLTGTELARRVSAGQPELRILLMSGYSEEAVDMGIEADGFVAKPFTPRSLVAAIDEALERPPRSAAG